jgi:hypothetical protein
VVCAKRLKGQVPDPAERELAGLMEAGEACDLAEGTILTESEGAEMVRDGHTIHVRPVWERSFCTPKESEYVYI